MPLIRLETLVLATAAALLLAACAPLHPRLRDTPLAEATDDPERFLAQNFGPDTILPEPKAEFLEVDSDPVRFKRLHLTFSVRAERVGANVKVYDSVTEITMEPDGGPFIRSMEVSMSGGKPTQYNFGTTYRNIGALRAQGFDVAKRSGKPADWVAHLQRLTFNPSSVSDPKSFDLQMDHRLPLLGDLQTHHSSSKHCEPFGSSYAASQVHQDLDGQARDYSCVSKVDGEADGTLIVYTYLESVGVFIVMRLEVRDARVVTLTATKVELIR